MMSLLVTFVFTEDLTQEQLNQIEKATEDIFKAPNFSLKSTSDSLYVLEEMKGQVVLLNFWATWCGPCRLEIPDFNDLYDNKIEILLNEFFRFVVIKLGVPSAVFNAIFPVNPSVTITSTSPSII